MKKSVSTPAPNSEAKLLKTLITLNEIGARINRLAMGQNRPAMLKLLAEGAVQAMAAGTDEAATAVNASAIIWIYDEDRQAFDPTSRVSAGEPERASIDDYPRPDGLGRQAIQQRSRLLSDVENNLDIHPAKKAAGARSLVVYPLIVADESVGLLYVYRYDELGFDEIELLALENFVNLAAPAIYYARQLGGLNQALARKVNELEKLERASRLISSRTNLDETLQGILSIGLELTAARYGSFELYDKKKQVLNLKALAGRKIGAASGPPLPVDEASIIGRVARHRQSLRIGDLRDPHWQPIYNPLPADQEMRSELAVPLIGAGEGLEGVLNIESPVPNAFTDEDQHLLESLATQAVIAIQEIRLLDAMQEIVEVLLTAEGDQLFRLIIDRACDLINVSAGSVWTIIEPDTLLLRQSTAGHQPGEWLPLDRSLTRQVVRLRQPLIIDNVQTHLDFPFRELAQQQGWVSVIIVPLVIPDEAGRAVGSFSLYATELRDFSDWDKKVLTCLANHAAAAIQDAELLAQLKEAQERQAVAETFAAVGDVAANLLHQLNNKVGAISARVQGIEDKCASLLTTSPYLTNNLKEIEKSARQAMNIVRDSMVHLHPAYPQPVDVSVCIRNALQRAAPGAAIKIFRLGLEKLPRARASEKQLDMVFYNLIDNALKAMDGQGELHLVGEWRGADVVVTIADTGPGISPDIRPYIFDFSLATVEDGESSKRLGFGLWWVKTFIERFDGQLQVDSEVGKGAIFTVSLPIAQDV